MPSTCNLAHRNSPNRARPEANKERWAPGRLAEAEAADWAEVVTAEAADSVAEAEDLAEAGSAAAED